MTLPDAVKKLIQVSEELKEFSLNLEIIIEIRHYQAIIGRDRIKAYDDFEWLIEEVYGDESDNMMQMLDNTELDLSDIWEYGKGFSLGDIELSNNDETYGQILLYVNFLTPK